MNFDRSTTTVTPLRWLNVIQRGGTDDWRDLYRRCQEHEFAARVAALLRMSDPDSLPSSRLWAFLLQDLHPDLQITLPESGPEGSTLRS